MRLILTIISIIALVATLTPAALYLAGHINKDNMKWAMFIATIVWFAVAPFCSRGPASADEHAPAEAD